ncbi:MAG: putative Xylose isomerase domain protein barrel [bacterium]|nr:putative Xylose isomerase domain protein barrel [bacterium]
MLPNVEKLAGRVDDVELLLFDVERDVPSAEDVSQLVRLKHEHALSYTLHTPLDASLASADETRRALGVDKVRRAIAGAQPLEPLGHTVHVYLGDGERDAAPPADLDAWRARARRSLEAILADVAPRELCVECIDYDFALIAPVVAALDLSVTLDVGHLLRDGGNLRRLVADWLPRARIVQLHGTRPDGRDHKSLRFAPPAEVAWLLDALAASQFSGVLTLEVFDPTDLDESLSLVHSRL